MSDVPHPTDPADDDPILAAAGSRLRARSHGVSTDAVVAAVARRRSRQLGGALGVAVLALAVLGLVTVQRDRTGSTTDLAGDARTGSAVGTARVERFLAKLDRAPVDPRTVHLVGSVSTFADCGSLIGDLREVGAEHVGSRGFGDLSGGPWATTTGFRMDKAELSAQALTPSGADESATFGSASGTTLGTNVQVEGVDELDGVKAAGSRIYDLDGKGDLRVTDAKTLAVLGTLDVTPKRDDANGGGSQVSQLLVSGDHVAVFGSETEVSSPIAGDPSAARSATSYLTIAFVDASDPAKPKLTDRVRIEGHLVSARLVGGEIRLVTGADMADLGFVVPTTPASIPKALEQNRRSVATSTAADWIPDWQRSGADPQPLVPCDRVYVPDTFAGVSMTSMVAFPIGSGRFEPLGTSIVAPSTTLYAGLDEVAVSSEVWVDPADRDRLKFDDWKTAIHEFSFAEGEPPTYEGSGVVEGSTVGQFAFGEVGDALGVVTTEGVPWRQDSKLGVDLTLLRPDGKGALAKVAGLDDLADGKGAVSAVRFVDGRILISTGTMGRLLLVVDVSDPAKPRRAGGLVMPAGDVGYFHPLPDHRALSIGSRSDVVGAGDDRQDRSWTVVHLLDVTDPDAPKVTSTWEHPWSASDVGGDHHAFTYWPERGLALFGIADTQWNVRDPRPNHAAVLGVDGSVEEVAVPVASKPSAVDPPCPAVEVRAAEAAQMLGRGGVALHCADAKAREVEWPRYQCYRVDAATVARFVPEDQRGGAWFACSPAPQPHVSRVLVVAGRPILLTDQTLEALDPTTFASTQIAYHPTAGGLGGW